MIYGKLKLLQILQNVPRRGWTWQKIKDLVDSLWREPGAFDITAVGSIVGTGTLADPLELENDDETPGTLHVYGTNASGTKGWWPLTAASTDDSSGSSSSGAGNDPLINTNYLRDWIEFEFRDIEAGTAADYVLDLKALVGYTIDSAVMQVDTGTLTVGVKIGTTAVTSISAVAVDTDIDETTATGANTVAAGNKVILAVSATYSGAPTLIRGKLNLTRT